MIDDMHELRRCRRIGRLLAAWLLLWFVAMAAAPITPLAGLRDATSAAPVASDASDAAHCAHSGHGTNDDHHARLGHDPQSCDDTVEKDRHAGHASGSFSHCPVCMHAASPPPPQLWPRFAGDTPAERFAALLRTHVRTRTDVPPPARGPPVLS